MIKASKPTRTLSGKQGRSPRTQGRRAKPTRPSAKAAGAPAKRSPQMWSAEVTRGSNALDLEPGVFKKNSPRAVAQSLKRSVEQSRRRKAGPFQSAMSMLNFYINRAGKNLPAARLQVLERAKAELQKAFGRH
ncbi:MAG: DUF3175 domain-containing protein [Hyphomicrobiaceae bacterium]|nr:DUF3175 domain-containing protein [Hyphomicrobiaceae bacterium]